jgi:nucleotide-binding universal stress UspA family protein
VTASVGVISPRTLLATVNFADASHAALVLAARLARHCGADAHVLYIEDPLLDAGAGRAGIDLATSSRVELRRLIRDEWPAQECPPQLHVVAGPEVDVILDVAHQHDADLIVIANRRISRLERFVFGSTTERLLRRSDRSVLVAPADWMPPDAALDASANDAGMLAGILGSCIQVVRGANGSAAGSIAYRALSAATVPILVQVVESVLG